MAKYGRLNKAKIREALIASGGMIFLTAERLGCSHQAIYNWLAKEPELQAVRDAETGKMVDVAEVRLRERILAGEAWAIQFALKTKGKDRGYVERQERHDEVSHSIVYLVPKAGSLDEWVAEQNGHAPSH